MTTSFDSNNYIVYRAPLLSTNDFLNINTFSREEVYIKYFMNNSLVQEAIYLASPQLFYQLKRYNNHTNIKKIKLSKTLIKYLIRMSTRPTPFGLFAGYFDLLIEKETHINEAKIDSIHTKNLSLNIRWIKALIKKLETDKQVIPQLTFFINEDIDFVIDHYSLFHSSNQQNSKIVENIYYNLLKMRKKNFTYQDIKSAINYNTSIIEDEIQNILINMLNCEVIISNLRGRNVEELTFENVFKKIIELNNMDNLIENISSISDLLTKYSRVAIGEGIQYLEQLHELMRNIVNVQSKALIQVDLKSSNAFRCTKTLSKNLSTKLSEIHDSIIYQKKNKYTREVTKRFIKKYGKYREVKLTELFDSIYGLNFQIDTLEENDNKLEQSYLDYWKTIITKTLSSSNKHLKLTKEEIRKLKNLKETKNIEFPVQVIIELNKDADDKSICVLKENCFIYEYGKMEGRFLKQLNPQVLQILKEHYKSKQNLVKENTILIQPNILYEDGFSNNLSPHLLLLDTQLTLGFPHNENSLDLTDLVVGYNNDHLYVRSIKYNKFIKMIKIDMLGLKHLPKFAQFIYHITNSSYSNKKITEHSMFDNFFYLPRISFDNIVISPATWNLSLKLLDVNIQDSKQFKQWLCSQEIPRYINYVEKSDQLLLLDLDNEICCDILWNELSKNKSIKLKEVIANFVDLSVNNKNHYFLDLILPLVSTDTSREYKTEPLYRFNDSYQIKKIFYPGEKWFYLKVYIPEQIYDSFLIQIYKPFKNYLYIKKIITDTHYIRYYDDDFHLRIRFLINSNHDFDFYSLISKWIDEVKERVYTSRIVIDTYEREIERYGEKNILSIEKIFSYQTNYALKLLEIQNIKLRDYFIFIFISEMTEIFYQNYDKKKEFLSKYQSRKFYRPLFEKIYPSFELNCNYWKLKKEEGKEIYKDIFTNPALFENIVKSDSKKEQLLRTIIHMFINKIYNYSLNKESELIALTYYFVSKKFL